ncbi:hypothetical protein B0T24DRAFT_391162 [Lasiosphaeria ovina]|uniref:NACHT domain-containing protein n=1 Tax=Lasiosphaeria ovina TaxID=92902 RepID=A0AAE0JW87_9PEZI|nr:hypothetical protein B0T24DRAFT_391162 [Lasiosphaeria ovina]
MSGLDALAAFGLACNVMQAISFAFKTASVCKEVFRTGSPDSNLNQLVLDASKVHENLKKSMVSVQPLNKDEKDFLDIAERSLQVIVELKTEIDRLVARHQAKGSVRASVSTTLRALYKKPALEKLEKRMQAYQSVLESGLLLRVCNASDASRFEQETRFNDLDEAMRTFIQALSKGQTSLEDLVQKQVDSAKEVIRAQTLKSEHMVTTVVKSESEKTRDSLALVMKEFSLTPPVWKKHKRLLRSLKYDTMNDRQDRISDSHEGTFDWILKGTRPWIEDIDTNRSGLRNGAHFHPDCSHHIVKLGVTWSCFPCWIESPNDKFYWVQGKAGSGKSTLMKFLVTAPDTWSYLKSTSRVPIVLPHFFWAAGEAMQRSIRGLLLNLLYQILSHDSGALDKVIERYPPSTLKDKPVDWSKDELQTILNSWLAEADRPVFIFLDGLDEFGDTFGAATPDTPSNLLDLVTKLSKKDNVKLCVSSRADPEFRRYFRTMPTLKLQHLTHLDMRIYVESYLLRHELDPGLEMEFKNLIDDICDKADGVFLWTALVTRSLYRGLANGDSIAELKLRLQSMPQSLHELYHDMWSRLNEDQSIYREEAARYFNMVRHWTKFAVGSGPITVFHIMAGSDPSKAIVILQEYSCFSTEEVRVASQRIATRSAGLLEIGSDGEMVGFIHRSALEFLEGTPQGQKILSSDTTNAETRTLNLMRAYLGGLCLQVLGKRPMAAYSETSQFHSVTMVDRLWASRQFSDEDGFSMMMACKKLRETGSWAYETPGGDSSKSTVIRASLDFYGVAASFGCQQLISLLLKRSVANPEETDLSYNFRAYLFIAASMDPGAPYSAEYRGKAMVLANILGERDVIEIEMRSICLQVHAKLNHSLTPSGAHLPPIVFLAVMNIHAGGRHWPSNIRVPRIHEVLNQYLAASFSLGDEVTVTYKRDGFGDDDDDDRWIPNIHGLGPSETVYTRQSNVWVTLKTNLASLVDLQLTALISGSQPKNDEDILSCQLALDNLRKLKPNRSFNIVAFGLSFHVSTTMSLLGDRDGKPVAPEMSADADYVLATLEKVRLLAQSQIGDEVSEAREYEFPGLWSRLKEIAPRAREVQTEEYENAIDLPLRKQLVDFMSKPPKPFTE